MRLPGSAGRSGGRRATPEGVVSMPPMLRPRAGTRDAATGRGLGISAPRAGTKDSALRAGDGRPHHNRGISAEMQCGTAPRAARDLTGEPCSIPRRAVRGGEFSARGSAWFRSKDGSGREWGGKALFPAKKGLTHLPERGYDTNIARKRGRTAENGRKNAGRKQKMGNFLG